MKFQVVAPLLPALLILVSNSSAHGADMSGAWTFSMSGPNGESLELPMELKVNGKVLEGRVDRGSDRWLKIKQGKVDGSRLSFTIERDRPGGGSMVYSIAGRHANDRLEGEAKTKFQGQEISGKWHAVRRVEQTSAIAGTWTLHLKDPNGGDVEFPMELKVADKSLTGRVGRGDNRWLSVKDGKVDGTSFSFTVERDRPGGGSMNYKMNGKVEKERLKGTASTTMDGRGEVTVDWHADRPAK